MSGVLFVLVLECKICKKLCLKIILDTYKFISFYSYIITCFI